MKRRKTFIHYQDFCDSHESESDRGYVLVACVILDSALEYCLRKSMRRTPSIVKRCIDPLFGHNGPLNSTWSKLQAAYATRTIPEWVYNDLEAVRSLRNDLAHNIQSFSFTDPAIEERLRKLRSPYRAAGKNNRYVSEERLKREMKRMATDDWSKYPEAKLRFAMMFHYIHGFLTWGKAYSRRRPTSGSSVFLTRGTPLAGQESRRGSESAEP